MHIALSQNIVSNSFSSDFKRNKMHKISQFFSTKIHLEVIKSRRYAARCRPGRSGNRWTKGLASRLKGSHPLLLPSLPSITIISSLSPLLSFIITARDFIPARRSKLLVDQLNVTREKKRKGEHGCLKRDETP